MSAENVSVLGINWNPIRDTLNLKRILTINENTNITLRNILKFSAQFYDQCKWFTPLSIREKILLQEIRSQNHEWDDILHEPFISQWTEIHNDLISAANERTPRLITTPETSESCHQ